MKTSMLIFPTEETNISKAIAKFLNFDFQQFSYINSYIQYVHGSIISTLSGFFFNFIFSFVFLSGGSAGLICFEGRKRS